MKIIDTHLLIVLMGLILLAAMGYGQAMALSFVTGIVLGLV